MKNILVCLFLSLSFFACSPTKEKQVISQNVNKQFLISKENLKNKKYQEASDILLFLNDEELTEREKAEKYNLLGIISFQQGQFQIAKNRFNQTLSLDFSDAQFTSQVMLNVASAEYKLNLFEDSFTRCLNVDSQSLKQQDLTKLYLLMNANALGLKNNEKQYYSFLLLNSFALNEEEYVVSKYTQQLSQLSATLTPVQKVTELSKLKDKNYYVVTREIRIIIDEYKKTGQVAEAQKLSTWVQDSAKQSEEAIENDVPAKWERKKIGVILPLTGDKASFARLVLMGLSLANELTGKNYQFIVRDSQDTPSIAANQVRDLVFNEQVALIIGGLFSTTSQHEFRMCNRLSTLFISLAPVYLPREFKRNLLFEVAGSVESQVFSLLKEETKKKLGKRMALFYSDDQNGQAYLEEFWLQAPLKGFDLVTLSGYPKNLVDYRDYIKDLFGIKFPRERAEEYALWYDIRLAQFKDNIKRAQILSPKQDFDWLFITANPLEVVQIIPSFHYLEVSKVDFVGGPQWRSSHLLKNNESLGNLIFVDSVESQKDARLQQAFKEKYNQVPKFVESLSFDALWLSHQLLDSSKASSRFNFKGQMTDLKSTKSFLSDWVKEDGLWMKLMDLNQITASGIGRL